MTSRTRRCAPAWACVAAACGVLAACAPSLDWREARPQGSDVQALLPCKPHQLERRLPLAGQSLKLSLMSCAAGDLTWGLAHTDVADPARVASTLDALRDSAAQNIGAAAAAPQPQAVPGATPQARSGRSRLQGRLPDGQPVQMQVLVFARGTVVYQASVVGASVPDVTADVYFESLRFPP